MPYITDIGLSQGRQDGAIRVTAIVLERLCGPLDDARRGRLERLPFEAAEKPAAELLNFRSMADFDAWLAKNG